MCTLDINEFQTLQVCKEELLRQFLADNHDDGLSNQEQIP